MNLSAGSLQRPGRTIAQGRHLRRIGGDEAAPHKLPSEADETLS
jgi:hypothetical protein